MNNAIFQHRKRGGSQFIVQLTEFGGNPFLDFREWVEKDGELTPTKRGCTLPPDIGLALGEALLALTIR